MGKGKWVIFTEDGLYAPSSKVWHDTKKDAIWEVSCNTLDPRPTPKVRRVGIGFYEYTPKDVDFPSAWADTYYIKHQSILRDWEMKEIYEEMKERAEDLLERELDG